MGLFGAFFFFFDTGQTHLDLCHTSRSISTSKIFTKFTLNDLSLKIDFVDFRSKLC